MAAERASTAKPGESGHDVAKAQRQKTGSREDERERDLRDDEAMAEALCGALTVVVRDSPCSAPDSSCRRLYHRQST